MKNCPRCRLRYPDHATTCFVDGAELQTMRDPRIGLVLAGRYELEDPIAEGGMATVYMARHRVVNRSCAVKILSATLVRNKVVRERFRREAKATQKLAHPNIIEILDHGETEDGLPYLVMELLEGETLAQAIAKGPMPLEVVLPIGVQIARALARAHDFDVIHRDLKPENVFLCKREGQPTVAKLLDFGIARSLQDSRITNAGEVFGTPQYMAPERISSIDAGPSADLYSLGVMLFEMCTGALPFDASDVSTFFAQHMNTVPKTLAAAGVKAPKELETLVASLMAKVAEKRPVDAHRVKQDLTAISEKAGIAVPAEPTSEPEADEDVPKTLPPASIDRWARRTLVFEQMLSKAHGANPPPAARDLLTNIQRKVREIGELRADSIKEQRKLSALEAKAREGRQRFGVAVDDLGIDASRARDAARRARADAERAGTTAARRAEEFKTSHAAVIQWEGRCAFAEPHAELAKAYRTAAAIVDRWLPARAEELDLLAKAAELERVVTDLEFQIDELRAALSRLEQSAETEREAIENRSTELGQNANVMEHQLMQLATDFCSPLREIPALNSLFQQLEVG